MTARKWSKSGVTLRQQYRREYVTWRSMLARCSQSRYSQERGYTTRGITVNPRWHEFEVFLTYVLNVMGPHPGKGWSIDRINNDGNYEPDNIRWATAKMQQHNRRPIDAVAVARKAAQTYRARTTAEQRSANARLGGIAMMARLTPEERVERARRAGRLGGRPRRQT